MGETKLVRKFFGFLILFSLFFNFLCVPKTEAANINFSMSILPVRFVYLDNKGEIEKIWSNVAENDSLYAIKFFNYNKKIELPENQEFMDKYFSYIENQKKCEFFSGGKINRIVEYKKNGDTFEEIQTIV